MGATAQQEWCWTTVVDWYICSGWKEKKKRHFRYNHYRCIHVNIRSITFWCAALIIRGEQDLGLVSSFLVLPLPWRTSSAWSLVWSRIGLCLIWQSSSSLLKRCSLPCLFWAELRLHVNSTVKSSPEGDSTNTARPSFDLTTVSPPGPNSAPEDDDTSGHCTADSMLKKGCRGENTEHTVRD